MALLALCLVFGLVTLACSRTTPRPKQLAPADRPAVVLVFPFMDMYSIYGDNVSYACKLCGTSMIISNVEEGADLFLTDALYDHLLKQRQEVRYLSPEQAMATQGLILFKDQDPIDEIDLIMKTGRKLGAEAILVGRVYRFQARQGQQLAAESPASVAFDLMLVRVVDRKVLWTEQFSESQKPLSENLFEINRFFDRRGQWLTAEQLAVSGIEQVLKTYPEL
jgi:hypothetical protein